MKGALDNPRPVDDTPVNGQLAHGVTSNWAYDHDADLDAHIYSQYQALRTGNYHLFPLGAAGFSSGLLQTFTANRLYAIPFIVSRKSTYDRIGMKCTTLSAGHSVRLGIYKDGTNLYPSTLVLDCGTVSVAATGHKEITIDQQLTKGIYWLVAVSDGTPIVAGVYLETTVLGLQPNELTYPYVGWYVAFSYAALPATFTAGGTIIANQSIGIALRLKSLDT